MGLQLPDPSTAIPAKSSRKKKNSCEVVARDHAENVPQVVMIEGYIEPVDLHGLYFDGTNYSDVTISLDQVELYLPVDMSPACLGQDPIPDLCWNVDWKCHGGSERAPIENQP